MKIAWLSPYSIDHLVDEGLKMTRPAGGHACSWIINWAKALIQQPDIDLHIITYSPRVPYSQSIAFQGYTVHVLRDAVPFTDRSWAGVLDLDARTGFKSRTRKLIKKLDELNPDVVHGHGTEDAYGLAAVQSNYPSVVSIQGVITDYLRTNPCTRFMFTAHTERRTVQEGRNFMCRTHFDKEFVKSLNPTAEIFHMPEAMNPCFFEVDRSSEETLRILHVGGFDERKGLEDLLVAISKIRNHFPEVKVDVVGSGSDSRKDYLVSRAKDLGVLDYIVFHGFLSASEIAELHSKATVYVITSRNENSPNTLAEALCAGTPCVAYDVGGISSMFVDGESGFLVPAGDTDLLVGKISQLFASPELGRQFSNKSREDGIANRPDHVAAASCATYSKILEVSSR